MTKLGFTAQKPIKLAYQRDPKKIEEWLTKTYPKIKDWSAKIAMIIKKIHFGSGMFEK